MECSCSISAGVDYFSEMLSEKWGCARKTHHCHECDREIPKGERYYEEKTIDDGLIDTHKTCADCISLRRNLVEDFFWGQIHEMIGEAIRDCDGNIPEKCLAKLTPTAREWVCKKIEERWEDLDEGES